MMYQYTLEKGSKKHYCINCNKKTFVRYIDTVTGDYLPIKYGRCDRENKCGYHLNPYKDGYTRSIEKKLIFKSPAYPAHPAQNTPRQNTQNAVIQQNTVLAIQRPIFFDFDTFKETLNPELYDNNSFIQNLLYNVPFPFDVNDVTSIIELYRIGTVGNACTFPFIDKEGNVRAVQVKQFDKDNHTTQTDFLHSIIKRNCERSNKSIPTWIEAYTKQDKIITCLFGEHLLNKYPNNPIGLVEAPKTAVYCSLYFGLPSESPNNFIWLAVYNKSSFSFDKIKVLEGRFVYVFPDLSKDGSTFREWEAKAREFEKELTGTRFIFSDLLERLATTNERLEGLDIADYLIKQDWKAFRTSSIKGPDLDFSNVFQDGAIDTGAKATPCVSYSYTPTRFVFQNYEIPPHIKQEIKELEMFFNNIDPPQTSFKLNEWTQIINYHSFIEKHFYAIKISRGNPTILEPHLNRLRQLKQLFANNA